MSEDSPKKSVLLLLKAWLESFIPYDLTWLEVLADELGEIRKDFSWKRLGDTLVNIGISLVLLYLFWDPIISLAHSSGSAMIWFAKMDIDLFLAFLPITLIFYGLEIIIVFVNFVTGPTKARFRIVWRSACGYAVLSGIYFLNQHYSDQIKAFIGSVK